MILDDDELRLTYFQRLEVLIWAAAWNLGLIKRAPWIKRVIISICDVLIGAEVFAKYSKIMFYRFIKTEPKIYLF